MVLFNILKHNLAQKNSKEGKNNATMIGEQGRRYNAYIQLLCHTFYLQMLQFLLTRSGSGWFSSFYYEVCACGALVLDCFILRGISHVYYITFTYMSPVLDSTVQPLALSTSCTGLQLS